MRLLYDALILYGRRHAFLDDAVRFPLRYRGVPRHPLQKCHIHFRAAFRESEYIIIEAAQVEASDMRASYIIYI